MNLRTPELLLIFYFLFPMKSPLVAQALLWQIKAIHASRGVSFKPGNPLSKRGPAFVILTTDGPGEDHPYGLQSIQRDQEIHS